MDDVKLKGCPNPWCTSTTPPLPCALKREGWRVLCGCGVSTFRFPAEAEAIAAWNRRAAEAALTAERERGERAAEAIERQVPVTINYLVQNGLGRNFAEVLTSHYLDVARGLRAALTDGEPRS